MSGRIAYNGGIIKEGLVLNLDVAKGYPKDGTIIYDLNNQHFNGNLINGPTYDWENYGTLYFDGSSTSCTIQNSENLYSDPFTINLFLKTSPVSNNSYLLAKQYDGGYGTYWLEETPLGYISFYVGTTTFYYGTSIVGVNREEWYYVTGVYENNRIYLYSNGVFSSSASTVGSLRTRADSLGKVSIGKYGSLFSPPALHTSLYFTNFSFYNRVLTPSEIYQNYNALKGRYGL